MLQDDVNLTRPYRAAQDLGKHYEAATPENLDDELLKTLQVSEDLIILTWV
jgi:hypothetical protein